MVFDFGPYLKESTAATTQPTTSEVDTAQESNNFLNGNSADYSQFGVMYNGNTVGFTELNKRMDAAGFGVDSQQRYDVQQAWLKNLDRQIEFAPNPELKKQWQEDKEWVLERALKEDSFWGAKAESVGKGFDQSQSGVSFMGAYAASHLDKTDGEIFDEIKKENAEKYALYLKAEEHLDQLAGAYSTTNVNDLDFGASGSGQDEFIRSIYKKKLSKEEQDLIDWFHNTFEAKRTEAVFGDKANDLTKWLSEVGIENMIEASKKSRFVGREERRNKIRNAADKTDGVFSSTWKTAKASWLDLDAAFDIGLESTGSQLVPQLMAMIGGGLIAKNPMVYQTIAALGNFPAEVQGAVADTLSELADAKYKKSLDQLTPEEVLALIKENRAVFSKAMDDGLKSATVIAMTEPLVAKGVGKAASQFSKLAQKAGNKSAVLEWLGYGAEAALEFTGEGWEEAFGQIASNIALGKRWDEGVGQSFVQALFSAEQIPNYVATVKDVTNNLKGEDNSEPTTDQTQDQAEGKSPPKLDPDLERAKQLQADLDRNIKGEYVNHTNDLIIHTPELVQQQLDENNAAINEIMVKKGFDPNNEESRQAFYDLLYGNTTGQADASLQESTRGPSADEVFSTDQAKAIRDEALPLFNKLQDGTITPEENARYIELEQEYRDATTFSNEKGDQYSRNLQRDLNEQRSKMNESGSIDRDGTQNADGSSVEQGINEPNRSRTESRGETDTTVPPTQTETSTTGYSQPNSGSAPNFTGEPDNLSQTGDTVGFDGRTGETDHQSREYGELGQDRSEQGGKPTQGPSTESSSGGVSERAESDRLGKALDRFDNSLSNDNAYSKVNSEEEIDLEIQYAESSVKSAIRENGDVTWELEYLAQAYAQKQKITGVGQKETFLQKANELLGSNNQEETVSQSQGDKVSKFGLKKVDGDGVFGESSESEQSNTQVKPRQEQQSPVSDETTKGNAPSDTATRGKSVEQGRTTKSERGDPSKKKLKQDKLTRESLKDKIASDGVESITTQDIKDLGKAPGKNRPLEGLLDVVDEALAQGKDYDKTLSHLQSLVKEMGMSEHSLPEAISRVGTNLSKSNWQNIRKHVTDRVLDYINRERTDFRSREDFQKYAKQLMDHTSGKDVAKVKNELVDLVWHRGITFNGKQMSEKTAKELHTYVVRLNTQVHNAEATAAREEATTRAREKARKEIEANQQAILDRPYNNRVADMQSYLDTGDIEDLRRVFRLSGSTVKAQEYLSRFAESLSTADKEKLANGLDSLMDNIGYSDKTKSTIREFANSLKVKQDESVKKEAPAQQPMAEKHKRESDVTRKVNEATAMAAEEANPFLAKMTGKDLRENQKIAHELYNKHKDDQAKVEQLKKAFIDKNPSKWVEKSWEAAKRGGFIVPGTKGQYNALVKDAVDKLGAKAGDLVRFDGTVEKRNGVVAKVDPDLFSEIQDHPIESQVVEIVNHLETNTNETVEVAIDRAERSTGVSVDDVKEELFKEKSKYFTDDNLQPLMNAEEISNEQLAYVAKPEVLAKYFSDISAKAKAFLDAFHRAITSALAIVAVAYMTVPHDAMAQQGFSTYTQGETIKGVSQEASNTINWVMQHKDHNGKNFVVADKDQGKIHIVSPDGKVLDTQNALFGKGRGNDNSDMNTPSGRMQLKKETNLNNTEKGIYGNSVLEFVDPDTKAAVKQKGGGIIAMHRVVNTPARKAALNSAKASDNYLSHGCVNIPTAFYNTAVDSLNGAMVYVLDHKDAKPSQQAKEVKTKQNTAQSKTTSSKETLTSSRSGLTVERSGLKLSTNDAEQAAMDKARQQWAEYEQARKAGKTELSFNQYFNVRTEAFKKWFGDWENDPKNASKAINPRTGEPLVLYHGTKEDRFNVFEKGEHSKYGTFFTDDKSVAETYGHNVEEVFVNIRDVMELDAHNRDFHNLLGKPVEYEILVTPLYGEPLYFDDYDEARRYVDDNDIEAEITPMEKLNDLTSEDFARAGHYKSKDGVIIRNVRDDAFGGGKPSTVFIVDKSSNIKSAVDNNGNFDGTNPNIRKSITEVNYEEHGLSKKEVQKALKKALGKLADRVTLINRDDFERLNGDYAYINRNGIEGFFDENTGHVFLVVDQIKKGNGLTAAERAAWVGWHELTHAGLDTKYGKDLKNILKNVQDDPFVSDIAKAIQLRRASRNDSPAHVTKLGATEEAIAEINAAVRTGNLKALSARYGVDIPQAYRDLSKELTKTWLGKLRDLFNKVIGRKAIISTNQVTELLRSLPQEVEDYAPVASRAITERVLSQLNNPSSAYNQTKYSASINLMDIADRAAKFVFGSAYSGEKPLDLAGTDPLAIQAGKAATEKSATSLTKGEKVIESLIDSQAAAIKFVGGLKSRFGQMIKTATNRTARVKQRFQKDVYQLLKHSQRVAKVAYKKRRDRKNVQNDLQNITTALASVTGINTAMMDYYEDMLYNPVYGLEAELQGLGVDLSTGIASQVASSWQAKEIGNLWQRYQEMKEIHEKSKASLNRLMGKDFARTNEDPERMRENLRMFNGQTTAEAYQRITEAVEAGLLNVTVKGKPWLEHIQDVGFTRDKGFADESKVYDINENDVEISGHFAPLIEEYVDLAQEIYKFEADQLGPDMVGKSYGNRFEVPTMGEVENMKFKVDQDGNLITKSNKTTQDILDLNKATEYQGRRMGRALLGANAIQNLNMRIDLAAQRTQYTPLFKELYEQRNDKNGVPVKVYEVNSPEFTLMKGAILHVDILNSNGKPTGRKKYVKVALDSDEATAALFGDNVQNVDNFVLNALQFFQRLFATGITFVPGFSLWNSWRGYGEKVLNIVTEFGGKDNAYFMDDIRKKNSIMSKIITAPQLKLFSSALLKGYGLIRGFYKGFHYLPAALAFADYMADHKGTLKHHGKKLRVPLVNFIKFNLTAGQKEAFNRLLAAYEQGTIATRAESYKLDANQMEAFYNSYSSVLSGVTGVTKRAVESLNTLQEKALRTTNAMELFSTLVTQDLLMSAGLSEEKANEANLYFMNFNDKGASRASSYFRKALPFANATAQGSRSLFRSLTRKAFQVMVGTALSSTMLVTLSALMQKWNPCPNDVGDPFENANPSDLLRGIPFRIGCGREWIFPIEYGAGMLFHAIGVAGYQLMTSNWDFNTALEFVWGAARENGIPVPASPNDKSNQVWVLAKSVLPSEVKTAIDIAEDIDDFGNGLSSEEAAHTDFKYTAGKANTAEIWTYAAEGAYNMHMNLTPEQTKKALEGLSLGYLVGVVDAAYKKLPDDVTRAEAVTQKLFGLDKIYKLPKSKETKTFTQTSNLLKRYEKFEKVVKFANQVGDEKTGKLKFGSKDSNLYTWIDKLRETGEYSERDLEIIEHIARFKQQQKRISSKKISKEQKNELQYENNVEFIKAMRPYYKGGK